MMEKYRRGGVGGDFVGNVDVDTGSDIDVGGGVGGTRSIQIDQSKTIILYKEHF